MSNPITPTLHYLARCNERGIPTDACDVVRRHGQPLQGRALGETVFWLKRLVVWQLTKRGLSLWAYENVCVVIVEDARAVTAFKGDEAFIRSRWPEGAR